MGIKTFFQSGKNRLRFALFAAALIIAVVGITYGVVQMGNKEPGYYALETRPETQVTTFDSGVTFMLHAQGSSDAIKQRLNLANAAYSLALERCYKLLDAEHEYEGYVNLATLNQHPGETFTVSEELFSVLRDALRKTEAGKGYSVFDGALYHEWRAIRYLESPTEFDPRNDPDTAARFAEIAQMSGERSHFTLRVINEETREIMFDISPEYKAMLSRHDIAAPVLDLNLLHDAYLLQLLAQDMTAQGFTDGYLYSASGISVTLNRDDMQYSLYGCADRKVQTAATALAPANTVCCQMTAFPLTESDYGFFQYEANGKLLYRHPWLDMRAGVCRDVFLSVAAVVRGASPADALYAMLRVAQAEDAASVDAVMRGLGDDFLTFAYTLQNTPDAVHIGGTDADALLTVADGYRLADD